MAIGRSSRSNSVIRHLKHEGPRQRDDGTALHAGTRGPRPPWYTSRSKVSPASDRAGSVPDDRTDVPGVVAPSKSASSPPFELPTRPRAPRSPQGDASTTLAPSKYSRGISTTLGAARRARVASASARSPQSERLGRPLLRPAPSTPEGQHRRPLPEAPGRNSVRPALLRTGCRTTPASPRRHATENAALRVILVCLSERNQALARASGHGPQSNSRRSPAM